MNVLLSYRGRQVTDTDVAFIRELIAAHPTLSRRQLSQELCRAWNWVQPNGTLRDMVCRGLMLALHRAGHLGLPERRRVPPNPLAQRSSPTVLEIERRPLEASLQSLGPLRVEQVRRTPQEALFNSLLAEHHYLGYSQPVGEHLKYLVFAQNQVVACLAWSSAPRHLGPRDRFLGWSAEARRKNLHLIATNLRFLVLPWVQVPHLASHILGRMARQLSGDWERVYGHPLYFLETFVDPERFRGTCYRAANWIVLGRTTGRGKDDQTNRPNRSLKEVLGYPLDRRFRRRLSQVRREEPSHVRADSETA